jgi:hypothetical protein
LAHFWGDGGYGQWHWPVGEAIRKRTSEDGEEGELSLEDERKLDEKELWKMIDDLLLAVSHPFSSGNISVVAFPRIEKKQTRKNAYDIRSLGYPYF